MLMLVVVQQVKAPWRGEVMVQVLSVDVVAMMWLQDRLLSSEQPPILLVNLAQNRMTHPVDVMQQMIASDS